MNSTNGTNRTNETNRTNRTNNDEYTPIYKEIGFKSLTTHETKRYMINMNWICNSFYDYVIEKIRRDFEIPDTDNVELIDVNQPYQQGNASNWGHPITWQVFDPLNQTKLITYFNGNVNQCAFYIKHTIHLPQLHEPESTSNAVAVAAATAEVNDYTCVICWTNPRIMVFTPCNHLCSCESCGRHSSITDCPICRTPIDSRIRIYY
jgi:hypothetical protein